jgi:hypothetical protein
MPPNSPPVVCCVDDPNSVPLSAGFGAFDPNKLDPREGAAACVLPPSKLDGCVFGAPNNPLPAGFGVDEFAKSEPPRLPAGAFVAAMGVAADEAVFPNSEPPNKGAGFEVVSVESGRVEERLSGEDPKSPPEGADAAFPKSDMLISRSNYVSQGSRGSEMIDETSGQPHCRMSTSHTKINRNPTLELGRAMPERQKRVQ